MANQTDVNQYVAANPGVVSAHSNWHMGGRAFPMGTPGAGEEFLQFHRDFLAPFRAWLASNGRSPLTSWSPPPTHIPIGLRSIYTTDRQTLRGTKTQLQAQFPDRDALGLFIEPGIHNLVHSAFGPPPNGNGRDPRFADAMTAPESIRFWRWHAWIDRVWTRSGL